MSVIELKKQISVTQFFVRWREMPVLLLEEIGDSTYTMKLPKIWENIEIIEGNLCEISWELYEIR